MTRMKTKQQATAETAPDPAAELATLLTRLTDAAARIDWGCRVPEPQSPATLAARERLAALGEKLSDARRKADTLRGEITDAEARARDLDEQAAAVADGADPALATRSLRAKRDELTDIEHAVKVLDRAITRERETLRRAIVAESRDAAAVVRPTFDAAVEAFCLGIRVSRAIAPVLMRLNQQFTAAGFVVGDNSLPNVAPPYELRPTPTEAMPDGSVVVNPNATDIFLQHVRGQGYDV